MRENCLIKKKPILGKDLRPLDSIGLIGIIFWSGLSLPPCFASDPTKVIEGRVEQVEAGAEPLLPGDLSLNGGTEVSAPLPASLRGKWFGSVQIKQMDTYPAQHTNEPYCQQMVLEINKVFAKGMKGDLQVDIIPDGSGGTRIGSFDIFFGKRGKLNLSAHRGPGLIPGIYHIPFTVKNEVRALSQNVVEQSRYDAVQMYDSQNRPTERGFTEVSAHYNRQAPGRLLVKILNVDYDGRGRPLWKALMVGYLYK